MTGFDTHHLSRRQFLRASALGAGALAVAGLGNTALASPNGAPAFVAEFQTNTLELWFDKWGPDETWTQLWSEVKEKTGITVHETVIPFSDLEAKTLTSLAGGIAPDLIFNHPIFTATWATKGVAIPLDPYLARPDSTVNSWNLSDFFQGAMDYNRWNGQIWGLPMDFESTLYYYNKTMLQNAGLQDPGEMWTADHNAWNLDVFADYATRLSSGSADTAIFGAGEIPKSVRVQAPWIWGNGGDLFSPDYSETLINSAGAVKGWAFLADHVRKGWSPSVAGRDQPYVGTMTPLFNSSRLAMIYQIRGYLSDLNQDMNLGMVPTPTMPNGMQITRCAPDSFSITSKAKDPDAAWAVMQIMIMRGSELLMLAKAASPNRLSLLQSDSWTKALAPWESNDMYQFSMSTARAVPLPPNFNEMDGIVEAAYDQIVLGQASESDAMNNAKSQIDPLLAEAMEGKYPSARLSQAMAVQHAGVAPRRSGRIHWRSHLEGYLFIAPWLIGFVLFTLGPMVASALISLTSFDILTPARWLGLGNYSRLLADKVFLSAVFNTLFYIALAVPAQLLVALGLALLLNLRVRGVGVFRTLFYLPTVVPAVAGVLLWVMLLQPDFGLFNHLLRLVHLPGLPWLTDTTTAKPALVLISLWYVGSQMLVFLAALQGVPQELYDAAHIDGAHAIGRFRNVTLPMITPALFFNVVIGIINASQTFTLAFIGTAGGPANSTKFLVLYIYEQGFQSMRMGYASALAWALLIFILILTLLQFRFSRWVYYEGSARG